jgi:16S rRNA (guanine966-N2)-methyltransferase
MSLRIIGGIWRGRKIEAPPEKDQRIRPTSDRVRENLFNILSSRFGGTLNNCVVADFCAGTGALGLEALSRGASSCTFLEKESWARALIDRNIKTLGCSEITRVFNADMSRLPKALAPVDLILCDPPYAAEFMPDSMTQMIRQGWRTYGKVSLHLFSRSMPENI